MVEVQATALREVRRFKRFCQLDVKKLKDMGDIEVRNALEMEEDKRRAEGKREQEGRIGTAGY